MKRTQEEKDERLLERNGWTVECWSPFEIRHEESGSFATKIAANKVLNGLRAERRAEQAEKRKPQHSLDALPRDSVVQDPDSPDIFWTKGPHDVWLATASRSAGMLHKQLGDRQPEVLFVPTADIPVWPPKKEAK
jgi:hypothetical protein